MQTSTEQELDFFQKKPSVEPDDTDQALDFFKMPEKALKPAKKPSKFLTWDFYRGLLTKHADRGFRIAYAVAFAFLLGSMYMDRENLNAPFLVDQHGQQIAQHGDKDASRSQIILDNQAKKLKQVVQNQVDGVLHPIDTIKEKKSLSVGLNFEQMIYAIVCLALAYLGPIVLLLGMSAYCLKKTARLIFN